MPESRLKKGDPDLAKVYRRFDGRLITPSLAGALLGLDRRTVATLIDRGTIRAFKGRTEAGVSWVVVPLGDVAAYGDRVGRAVPYAGQRLR